MPKKEQFDLRIVSQLFYPEMVSSGQALTELAEELNSLGLRIKVIASQPTILENSPIVSKFIDYKNIKIVRTWSTRFPKLSFWGKLFNLTSFFFSASLEVIFRDRKVPLLLVTNPPYLSVLGWFNRIFNKTNYGVLLFDIMPEQAELLKLLKPGGIFSRVWRLFNKLWYKNSSYVVVLSKDMLEGALDNASISGTKYEPRCRAKTHVIHVWSDDRIISPMSKVDSKLAEKFGVKDKLVIQYSGNHGRFHDIETILKIVEKMSSNQKVIFQFIGEGYKKKLVNDFYADKKPANMYVGTYVPKELLSDSLAMADLGIVAQLPKQERVCYPSKLLGVMSSGRAVLAICSRNSEMAKMIEDNGLGFTVENGDVESAVRVINEGILNPELLKKYGDNAALYVRKHFSLRNAAEKYYKVIKSC
jgi:glycosyltransferase involved in cell wall biosynthesis